MNEELEQLYDKLNHPHPLQEVMTAGTSEGVTKAWMKRHEAARTAGKIAHTATDAALDATNTPRPYSPKALKAHKHAAELHGYASKLWAEASKHEEDDIMGYMHASKEHEWWKNHHESFLK